MTMRKTALPHLSRIASLCPIALGLGCWTGLKLDDQAAGASTTAGPTTSASASAGTGKHTTTGGSAPGDEGSGETTSDSQPDTGAGTADPAGTTSGETGASASGCIFDGDPFDVVTLRERVEYLASPELGGRVPGSAGDIATRELIEERFACLGLVPGGSGGSYQHPFTVDGNETANVVGFIPGSDPAVADEIIVIGAHHDHLGNGRLGANDNASGTTGLLAAAQAIRQRSTPPRRTIAFVAFGAEEEPYFGSNFYVDNPPGALPIDDVVYMVNMDMIGSYGRTDRVYALGTTSSTPGRAIVDDLRAAFSLNVSLGGTSSLSDNGPFCDKGIPYVFFWTSDEPPAGCYHQTCDTPEKLDYPEMAQIADMASQLTMRLADSEQDLAAFGCSG